MPKPEAVGRLDNFDAAGADLLGGFEIEKAVKALALVDVDELLDRPPNGQRRREDRSRNDEFNQPDAGSRS